MAKLDSEIQFTLFIWLEVEKLEEVREGLLRQGVLVQEEGRLLKGVKKQQ